MLNRRKPGGGGTMDRYLLPILIGLTTAIILGGEIVNAQRYNDSPPRYSYDNLPKTGFQCRGKLPGRYYPDPETDCQMFHVCVKMNHRDVQDFKFLCPNGTVFDSEHQVCIDYYQVVCHSDPGTNPLGQIFEIFKLSSGHTRDLDVEKLAFASPPDSVEKNTLGDDFQVEEYNNNRLASSQNALNFRASPPAPTKTTKKHKAKEDIFFNNKGFVPSDNFGSYQSTTRRPPPTRTTSTTTTTTTTEAPSSSTPRRPSLETFESYETESFSGFIPSRNSFNGGFDQPPSSPPDFDASTEDFIPKDELEQFRTTKPSTTQRPYIFQNTFRTTLSHAPSTARPAVQQTFQQQASRFNDDYFTRVPSTTKRPLSKAAQFFLHSTVADDYFTPEYRQPTENPFTGHRRHQQQTTENVFVGNRRHQQTTETPFTGNRRNQQQSTENPFSGSRRHQQQSTENPFVSNRRHQQSRSTSTTIRPSLVFQSNSGTVRPRFSGTATTVDYQYETSTIPTTTTTTEVPSTTTEYFGRYKDDFETRQTTTYNNEFSRSTNFFNAFDKEKQRKDDSGAKSTSQPRDFPPQLSPQYVEEESLRPRNIHGSSNSQNTLSINPESQPVEEQAPRDNFGFSTIQPPTTAEPFSTPPPTTSAVTEQETAQTLATRLQNQLFKKTTTVKSPEKYSIFFGRSTHSVSDDRLPAAGPTASYYDSSSTPRPRQRVRSTTSSPDFEKPSNAVTFDRRRLISRFGSASSTIAPETNSTRSQRRGARRRVKIPAGQRLNNTDFDPELKYKRRRFESGRVNNGEGVSQIQKNDEIFNAEASVFRGDPSLNYFQEQRKNEKTEARKIEQAQKPQHHQNQQQQPVNHYEKNYGRRVRPNGRDDQSINANEGGNINSRGNVPANRANNGEGPLRTHPLPPGNGPQLRRRVVKRLRPKANGTEPEDASVSDKRKFIVTGSTLRPVTRINIKTKLGGKISTTYRTTEITDGSSSATPSSSTTSTTEEPELVTASDDVIAQIRHKNSFPPTSLKKQFLDTPKNDSHLVIKLINDKPSFPIPSSSHSSSPFSIKKPIISTQTTKKLSQPPQVVKFTETKKNNDQTKSNNNNNNNDEESNTRSPDYDYAYYNTDDASDYDAETGKLDHKNYGKKPKREHSN